MTTDNALDPLPARRRTGRVPYPRIAAIVAGLAIAVVVILVIAHMVFQKPNQQEAMRAGFARGAGSSAQVTTPPAVTPASAAQASANLQALQQAADAPALAATPVQISTVSPPAGPAPKGDGVTAAEASVGPANG
jgi:hypothetical protein